MNENENKAWFIKDEDDNNMAFHYVPEIIIEPIRAIDGSVEVNRMEASK